MIIMPSNNTGYIVQQLLKEYPERIAFMFNPTRWWNCHHSYALDNGAFAKFDEKQYFKVLDKTKEIHPPMFIVCVDVVGCHDRTVALWDYYYPKLKEYGYPIAFVAQDGCEPETVPSEADWIFIGGTDPWKMQSVEKFIGIRPVHVGRVNSLGRLKTCERMGVTSIDGTGWMRARDRKFYDLMEYFHGEKQCSLF